MSTFTEPLAGAVIAALRALTAPQMIRASSTAAAAPIAAGDLISVSHGDCFLRFRTVYGLLLYQEPSAAWWAMPQSSYSFWYGPASVIL